MFLRDRILEMSVPEPNTGCWLWTSAFRGNRLKYGVISVKNKSLYAHRASYETFVGPVGDSFVLHKCDTSMCVNPDHLWLGSLKENMQDCKAKGRNPTYKKREFCKQGHAMTKENSLIRRYKGIEGPYCKTCAHVRDKARYYSNLDRRFNRKR